jgi:FKBP-type peptidyl-prolyl cis-trans isomerase FkpA/FKBP-type peptidyl-prolyl cis-trans isomerase FklB
VPPNANLHFLIEVFKVYDAPQITPEAVPGAEDGPNALEPGEVDSDAPEEFTTTESGLKYRIRRKSDGKKPSPTDVVSVQYRGWLDNKRIFDSSYSKGTPVEFGLNGVIKGWTEGLQLIGEGGMIELEIPPELGYGPAGHPPAIPPNSTLHFLVELKKVK